MYERQPSFYAAIRACASSRSPWARARHAARPCARWRRSDSNARPPERLGALVMWDLGRRFPSRPDESPVPAELPACWRGRFLLQVRGTPRCLLFDRSDDRSEISRRFYAEFVDHCAHEHEPSPIFVISGGDPRPRPRAV